METKASIGIIAPIDKVFEYASKPQNLPHFIFCINSISNVAPEHSAVGQTFDWVLNVAGVTLNGKGEVAKLQVPHIFEMHFEGDMEITWKFNFFPIPGGTQIDLAITYNFQENPLSKLGDQQIVANLCKVISRQILENLKVLIESINSK